MRSEKAFELSDSIVGVVGVVGVVGGEDSVGVIVEKEELEGTDGSRVSNWLELLGPGDEGPGSLLEKESGLAGSANMEISGLLPAALTEFIRKMV